MLKNENEIMEAAKKMLSESFSDGEKGVYSLWKNCEDFFVAGYQMAILDNKQPEVYHYPNYDDGYVRAIKTIIEKMYETGYCLQYIEETICQIYGSRNSIFPMSEIPVWADKTYPGGFPERIKRATASIVKLYDSGKLYSIQTVSEQYGIAEGDIVSILHSHDLSRTETARELTVAMYRQGNDLATIVKAVQGNSGDRYASASQIQGWIEEIYKIDECDD
ncbi:hypothetical protein NE634_13950 [Lacrimispora saccharolytica]|nr:hypothetical protein [Lacrimispora saccharolytica]